MGCGGSSSPQAQAAARPTLLVPGQSAIIRNCPNAKLNGKRVVCEEYNASLGEWQVKGEGFPLSIGMSMPTQYLEVVKSNDAQMPSSEGLPEPQPNLLIRPVQVGDKTGDGKLVIRNDDLLKTTLESCLNTLVLDEPTKLAVGDIVNKLGERADTILNEGAGKGSNGEDEDVDAAFYSQLATICEILKNLDTSAVFLPEEIDQNIQLLKGEALWPNWFDGELKKSEAAARRCLAIGKEWKLEETERYQNALAKLECDEQSNVQN